MDLSFLKSTKTIFFSKLEEPSLLFRLLRPDRAFPQPCRYCFPVTVSIAQSWAVLHELSKIIAGVGQFFLKKKAHQKLMKTELERRLSC